MSALKCVARWYENLYLDNICRCGLSYPPLCTQSGNLSGFYRVAGPHAATRRPVRSTVLQPGTVLRERYKIIESVKSGGMGAVYEAEDLRLEGRRCAIKEILLDPGMDETARTQAQEQFHREASILARLDHPNLPKVSDYFSDSDHDFLVMDFVPGRDLKDIMDEARRAGRFLEERDVLNWVTQLMRCARLSAHPGTARRPPRHQARQHQAHARRAHQAGGLWAGQGARPRRRPDDHGLAGARHGGLHAPRTIRRRCRPHRCPQRHLLARRDALSLAHQPVADGRQAALSAPRSAGRSHRVEPAHFIARGASHHSRAGAASHRPAF